MDPVDTPASRQKIDKKVFLYIPNFPIKPFKPSSIPPPPPPSFPLSSVRCGRLVHQVSAEEEVDGGGAIFGRKG